MFFLHWLFCNVFFLFLNDVRKIYQLSSFVWASTFGSLINVILRQFSWHGAVSPVGLARFLYGCLRRRCRLHVLISLPSLGAAIDHFGISWLLKDHGLCGHFLGFRVDAHVSFSRVVEAVSLLGLSGSFWSGHEFETCCLIAHAVELLASIDHALGYSSWPRLCSWLLPWKLRQTSFWGLDCYCSVLHFMNLLSLVIFNSRLHQQFILYDLYRNPIWLGLLLLCFHFLFLLKLDVFRFLFNLLLQLLRISNRLFD